MEPELFDRISASCRGLEPQFNTNYILECCQKLEEAGEYQSDSLLLQLVRLQEIQYRMGRSFPYDEYHGARRPDLPVDMFVRAWQKELQTFWASMPAETQQNSKPSLDKLLEARWLNYPRAVTRHLLYYRNRTLRR